MYLLQTSIETENLTEIILAGGIIIVLLAVAFLIFVVFARNRQNKLSVEQDTMKNEFEQQLFQSQIEVQEYTSNALSKELHDNVGQLLNTAKMLIGLTGREMDKIPDKLKTAEETIAQAINELRSLSKSLDKEWLSHFSFIKNIEQEVIRLNTSQRTQLKVTYNQSLLSMHPDEQIMLFRIVQEALQNAIKHGLASAINMQINTTATELEVTIQDNGIGFNQLNNIQIGLGLKNMKHRTKVLGGKLQIHSQPGTGTTILITLPLNKEFL